MQMRRVQFLEGMQHASEIRQISEENAAYQRDDQSAVFGCLASLYSSPSPLPYKTSENGGQKEGRNVFNKCFSVTLLRACENDMVDNLHFGRD